LEFGAARSRLHLESVNLRLYYAVVLLMSRLARSSLQLGDITLYNRL
jgi:hypothetical protein